MGRKKQALPHRSGGISENSVSSHLNLENRTSSETSYAAQNKEEAGFSSKAHFVEIDQSYWTTDEHLDIAEILVTDSRSREGFSRAREEFSSHQFTEECYKNPKSSLRFRLRNVDEHACRLKFGHWPVIPAEDIILEFLGTCTLENKETEFVIFSGIFDGPGEAVSGLVHLVSQKILMVRPVKEARLSVDVSSLTMRVEILKSAFNACESLLENTRKLWKKSLMSVMAWLRPEVTTHEAIYGLNKSETTEVDTHTDTASSSYASRKHTRFNAAGFYDSIKPSKGEPMLDDVHPDLLPELRPYQRRAAYWMVLREKRASESLAEREQNQLFRPFCVPVGFLDTHLNMFYNPFSGNISLLPESSSSYVPGGVLADEMGLGKTVELLACIFTHRKSISEDDITFDNQVQFTRGQTKKLKRERIECICGAVNEIPKYKGLWVQCDICDAWQHADCVGYLPAEKTSDCQEVSKQSSKKISSSKLRSRSRNRNSESIVEMGDNYVCQMCLELIQAAKSPVTTGATLIVCPAPILQQWHAEIIRHTKPGSLKTCVYEGVRNASLSATSTIDVGELVNADIVLTTYEILKEDLSHDTDRHEGDRRFMRFNKRYPVIPTPLTRIFWWRICLDEAQMVESNTAAATEMAMRLHGKHRWCITGTPIQRRLDDLYGLLRFLKASPFDAHRWWVEVIRDPYERKDAGSMKFAHKFFKQIMWRSSKAHVADELQLPPQKESVSWLFFSPIEAHFYQRQHETCLSYAREVIQIYKDEIHKSNQDSESSELSCDLFLTHTEAAKLLHSLLKLRQACCHPQVGSSGLRSMQQSPMSMEEILGVLVCKTKTEGEEALRKLVVALNGLAGIAVIEKDLSRAVSLYREALTLAEEHSDDFRLDPLLNLHIHYNLCEILPVTSDCSLEGRTMDGRLLENPKEKDLKRYGIYDFDPCSLKRQKISKESSSDVTTDYGNLKHQDKLSLFTSDARGLNGDKGAKYDVQPQVSSSSISDSCLRMSCANIKQKYLSVFLSKLSLAQQEFRNSHVQVTNAFSNSQNPHISWWMEALHLIEKNQESSDELIRRICEAVSGTLNSSKSSKTSSKFRSISGLKYLIQTGLDSLETSRQALLKRLLEIDETMENPRDEDIVRVRYCQNCQDNSDGPICVLCELDELFQVYEARLFRLTKGGDAEMIESAEEAVALQKKTSALNRFYWALSRPSSASTPIVSEENKKQREVRAKIVVSRSPSELEIVIGVIRNYSKGWIGRESSSMASKHLICFEAMRKEYGQARSLATAQAQMLRAHDEIKMATSRLRLTDDKNDTAVDALSSEELTSANVQFSNEKFVSLSLLSRIKGQLRYLQGLVLSRQKTEVDRPNSSLHLETTNSSGASRTNQQNECMGKVEDESCPVCHEKLGNQKMVFQCGHVTCCKCLVALTEHRLVPQGKSRDKWVMCPTCRQHTDIANIAYADDRQSKACNSGVRSAFQGHEIVEDSINVRGSYGTKMEAVTRRILWIKSTDPKAKVLVFSSWNDVLDVLEHAFFANDINYIRMKGGRKSHVAIAQFRGQKGNTKLTSEKPGQQLEEKSFQVLLLLIQHGANGLNLLEAQHVILVEPLLNPATEAQAISRVHRIGQDKTTLVHRFIVKDTVEESIYKLGIVRKTSSVISGNTRNQDQPVLTLKDVESLFCSAVPSMPIESESIQAGSLLHLPPAVASSLAAERRWREGLM